MATFTTGILLDQGLPRSSVDLLRARGADSEHVAALGLEKADDATILAEASRRGWTVATLDADFHRLLAISGARSPSSIHLRLDRLRASALVEVLERVFERAGSDLLGGAAVTVTPTRIRVRRLPLRG
jgi:predicted nuclease of predicted toxin-antitoxin system